MEVEPISITTQPQPAIHVNRIVNSGTAETISIVIPLSAQVTISTPEKPTEEDKPELLTSAGGQIEAPAVATARTSTAAIVAKADKSKGCPYPTCSRYGRAFSRAHDLKRHIARHETRKERLCEATAASEVRTCSQCGESFQNDAVLRNHMSVHATPSVSDETRIYPCHLCKKKYTQLVKLRAHIASHDKKFLGNVCALCAVEFDSEEKLEIHMKEHTASILEAQKALESTVSPAQIKSDVDNDDFMLEEMLLLKKPTRLSTSENDSSGKIRCYYCSKTFKTKWTLSSHVAAHEGRFQFGCSRCGKKFVRKSHYDGHVRSHEAARPYVCDQCGKTFKEMKHRREHTKRKHPSNHNAIQNLLDSISACVAEESMEQTKFTLLMPMNFTT